MKALKILIIEDDLLLGEELQEQLLDFGYSITDNVANSEQALRAFRRRLPDLVICDINLEGSEMDGIQLAEQFNKTANVPIIFLTAFGDSETVTRAKNTNPAYYLIKPCNVTQLQVGIDFAISNFTTKTEANPNHSLKFQSAPPCVFYSSNNFFFVKDGYKYVRVEIADIFWVEALGTNVKIITEEKTLVLAANLSSFSRQVIHKSLIRVHRSFLINIHKVTAFDSGRAFLKYKNEQKEIPIGKTHREGFQQLVPRLLAD